MSKGVLTYLPEQLQVPPIGSLWWYSAAPSAPWPRYRGFYVVTEIDVLSVQRSVRVYARIGVTHLASGEAFQIFGHELAGWYWWPVSLLNTAATPDMHADAR